MMKKPIKTVDWNHEVADYLNLMNINHFICINERLFPIQKDRHVYQEYSLSIINDKPIIENDIIINRFKITNEAVHPFKLKLVVENFLVETNHDYAFISPKHDVIFITNENGLYLTSGMLDEKSIHQYGIINSKGQIEHVTGGVIPFCPIGSGEVSAIYSLEQEILPNQTVTACTWAIFSHDWTEKELIVRDKQLKSTLAF